MLSLYFIYFISIWAMILQNTNAFTTHLKPHAKAGHLRNWPCPSDEEIAPCKCEYKGGIKMNMRCNNIANEQELYNVFHSRIPFPRFDTLSLDTSRLETLSDDVFGEATFTRVYMNVGGGNLKFVVDPKAFIKSTSTLKLLNLSGHKLSSFPFETLRFYTQLEHIDLSDNPITSFPIIESQTLINLILGGSLITEMPDNALDGIPNLSHFELLSTSVSRFPNIKHEKLDALVLDFTLIESIPDNALDGLPKLRVFLVHNSPISEFPILKSETLVSIDFVNLLIDTVPDGALDGLPSLESFWVANENFDNMATGLFKHLDSPELFILLVGGKLTHLKSLQFEVTDAIVKEINLSENQIARVDVDAFKGVKSGSINMRNNLLTTLPEATWGPVIEAGVTLQLAGNSLTCGCDVAWLVLEPSYHKLVADARCYGGELMVDLDPQIFQIFCP